jgi:crossover junction endodeoxyribonuclease RuvC
MNESSAKAIRVLGIDPAAAGPTGYAIIEQQERNCRVLYFGAFQVAAKRQRSSPGAALQGIHTLLCDLISKFKPQVIAVESIFTALNIKTALRLAEVRGVILLAAEQLGLPVHSYSPREVKACITGYGHADKRQMQIMVKAQLGMDEIPEPSDAADALAVALCHLQTYQLEQRFGVKKQEVTGGGKAALRRSSSLNRSAPTTSGIRI